MERRDHLYGRGNSQINSAPKQRENQNHQKIASFSSFFNYTLLSLIYRRDIRGIIINIRDKSAHNEIRDFYAHMALTYERHIARCFCHIPETSLCDISYIIKKHPTTKE